MLLTLYKGRKVKLRTLTCFKPLKDKRDNQCSSPVPFPDSWPEGIKSWVTGNDPDLRPANLSTETFENRTEISLRKVNERRTLGPLEPRQVLIELVAELLSMAIETSFSLL